MVRTRSGLDTSANPVPTNRAHSPFPGEQPSDILRRRRDELEDIQRGRRRLLERLTDRRYAIAREHYINGQSPRWVRLVLARPPKLINHLKRRRRNFRGLSDHQIEMTIRLEIIKWDYVRRTGRFMLQEVLDAIGDSLMHDSGALPRGIIKRLPGGGNAWRRYWKPWP